MTFSIFPWWPIFWNEGDEYVVGASVFVVEGPVHRVDESQCVDWLMGAWMKCQ